jgi:hypothetical protein
MGVLYLICWRRNYPHDGGTRPDACLHVRNALTDAGTRGVWLRNGSILCFSLWDPGGIYMP